MTELLLEHARTCANGVIHPAALGSQLAHAFAERYGKQAMVVNPPDTDEMQEIARVTGIKGVNRMIHLHALNLKETAIRHSKEVLGKKYEECNYVVCHIGGGVSVSAHRKGRMVDGYDNVGGEGPMAPTRCGAIGVAELLNYIEKNNLEFKDVRKLLTSSGGFVSHVGISDAIEINRRAAAGDRHAEMIWKAMIYQLAKAIGAMAAVLEGKVDGILLGGGMVHNAELVQSLKDYCGWIAPVTAYPGEFEMEAMAAGANRVLNGEEELKTYTGKLVWEKFDCVFSTILSNLYLVLFPCAALLLWIHGWSKELTVDTITFLLLTPTLKTFVPKAAAVGNHSVRSAMAEGRIREMEMVPARDP